MEKLSPYLFFDKVGPWEEEIKNPFIKNTTIESFFHKTTTPIHEKKLPLINPPFKTPLKTIKKQLSIPKDQNIMENSIKNKANLTEKARKNFLLPRRKAFKTIHMEEMKEKQRRETENFDIREKNIKENVEKTADFKPILNILKNNEVKTNKTEFQIKTIDINQAYFTTNPRLFQQSTHIHTNTRTKQSFSKNKSNDLQSLPEDFYLKGLVVGKILKNSLHFAKNTDKIKKRNSDSQHKIRIYDETEIKERKEKKLKDEAIKIKIDRLKKIEKNSTHFLKFFLLKYDEDLKKKQRFLSVRNSQMSKIPHI